MDKRLKLQKELDLFKNREKDLRKVKRYSLYKTMFYRTDLWTHTRRVSWIVGELIPLAQKFFGNSFEPEKALALAFVHDDAEIVFGDIQAGNKAKMNKEELKRVEEMELSALEDLSKRYPVNLSNYIYHDLLLEAVNRESVESIIVNWADKYDAYCEALHELYAGNKLWSVNVVNEYGRIDIPTEYYIKYFNSFESKFPKSKDLFLQKNKWFTIPEEPNIFEILDRSYMHTRDSLNIKKNYLYYDQWIDLTLNNGTEEDIENLFNIKEK